MTICWYFGFSELFKQSSDGFALYITNLSVQLAKKTRFDSVTRIVIMADSAQNQCVTRILWK
jgi:hypothetical protein